jgi:zinc protease
MGSTLQWKNLPGSRNTSRTVLENGITLLNFPNFETNSVVVSGYLGGGSMFDPDEKLGLALFTAQALMRGTENKDHQAIYDELESVGATLGFGSSIHSTSFGGRALVEDLPLLVGMISECLRRPAFPQDQIERLRMQMLTSLQIRDQDTEDRASLVFNENIFPGHPYGRPEDGYIETVSNIELGDLYDFHKRYYGPAGMVIVVVGPVALQQSMEQVLGTLGTWENPFQVTDIDLPPIVPVGETVRKHLVIPGKSQTDLVMGCLGPARNSDDYLPAALGNNILGQFGMMGRIGDTVREKAGLAYYASTSLNAGLLSGTWEISAGINPENLERALDLIMKELERFIREEVSEEELADSRSNFIGRLPMAFESNAGIANGLVRLERFGLDFDYYVNYPNMLALITAEDILRTAQKFLHLDRFVIISAGPEEK